MGMGDRIKERRIAMHYTQEELALKLGLQKSAIAKYENGRVENIKRSVIALMSEVLECSPSYLMGWDDKEETNKNDITKKLNLDTMRQLNDNNISKVNKYAENLLNLQQMEDEPVLMAAHHDNPTPEEQEKIMRDMDTLKRPTK